MTIIDSHAHAALEAVLPTRFFDGWVDNLEALLPSDASPMQRMALLAMFRSANQDHGCDKLVAQMDKAGIAKTVLLIVDFGFAYPDQLDALDKVYDLHREFMKRHPDRFIVFAGIDPRRGKAGVDLVDRAVREWGFRGMKIYPPCGYSPAARELDPFYEVCAAHKIPVLTHIGPTSPTLSFKFTRPDDVEDAAFRHPGVNFILGHAGVTWEHEAMMLAAYRPNIYLDMSGFQPHWKRGELDGIVASHKKNGILRKLLWGTDWPIHFLHGDQKTCVDAFRDLAKRGVLTDEELDWLFHKNAQRVFSSV